MSFEITGAVAFEMVRLTVDAALYATGGAAVPAATGAAGIAERSSGGLACAIEAASTTGAGWVVEPGTRVVGSAPTPASVATAGCEVVDWIGIGVPVWSFVTVALAIAAASASTTGVDAYVADAGDVDDDEEGANE